MMSPMNQRIRARETRRFGARRGRGYDRPSGGNWQNAMGYIGLFDADTPAMSGLRTQRGISKDEAAHFHAPSLQPLENANVAPRTVAERLQRLLIAWPILDTAGAICCDTEIEELPR